MKLWTEDMGVNELLMSPTDIIESSSYDVFSYFLRLAEESLSLTSNLGYFKEKFPFLSESID